MGKTIIIEPTKFLKNTAHVPYEKTVINKSEPTNNVAIIIIPPIKGLATVSILTQNKLYNVLTRAIKNTTAISITIIVSKCVLLLIVYINIQINVSSLNR